MNRASELLIAAGALLLAPVAALLADDSPKPLALSVVVTPAEGEPASGTIGSLADGKLTLATDPPRSFDLDDLERIEFGKSAPAAASAADLLWIGQDNHDLVQVGGAPGGNGIQDLHLRAEQLSEKAIKQITVVCRFPKQLRVWRLDTSQSPHWRLAIARSELAPQADLYLEPGADDSFGMKFDVTVTYNDDSTTKLSTTATTHTSDQAKIDRGTQPGTAASKSATPATGAAGAAEVYLLDRSRLNGQIVSLNAESLVLRSSWEAEVQVPILHVSGIWFGNAAPANARADFDKQSAAPVADDVIFLIAPDKSAAQVSGGVQSLTDDKLHVHHDGADRTIGKERLLGVVFAAHPKIALGAGAYQAFMLASGESMSGKWVGLSEGGLEIETPWQARLRLPASAVSEVRVRNGKLVYLPDLEPASVEEVSYFGRVIPWGRDRGFDGGRPLLKGKKPLRTLAMHSRSILSYDLDGQFDAFKATVGFDDSSAERGRVVCRVTVDGREMFLKKDLRADQDPMPVEVAIAGAKQLTLEVDFGDDEDIGDRVLWAEPRLFRSPKK